MNFLSKTFTYFIVSAQELSFKRASDRLFITPSPLGKIINNLEDRLGYEVFQRNPSGLKLTSKGNDLYELLIPFYNEIKNLETYLKNNCNSNKNDCLKISTNGHYYSGLIAFTEELLKNNKTLMEFDIYADHDIHMALQTHKTDIYLSTKRIESRYDFNEICLQEEKIKVVYSPGLLSRYETLENVLSIAPWIQLCYANEQDYFKIFNEYLLVNNVDINATLLSDLSQIMSLVGQGLAYSLVPESLKENKAWENYDLTFDTIPSIDISVKRYIYHLNSRKTELSPWVNLLENSMFP